MPPRKRSPTTQNGSPLSPPPDSTTSGVKPPSPNPTSPLGISSSHHLKCPPVDNPVLEKIQRLSDDERKLFLAHNFDKVSKKPNKLQYYNILYLSNPGTSSRPSHLKESLINNFLTNVRPLLKLHLLPPPAPKPTEPASNFDPLGRRTTQQMLTTAIRQSDPDATLPALANIDDVLILYKEYVDPELKLPVNESLAMNKETLMDLYIKFVRDETPRSKLILGFHHTLLHLTASDLPHDPMDTQIAFEIKISFFQTPSTAMPLRQKKTNQAHWVVCLCTAYECCSQSYADANGRHHRGVEVSPETRITHKHADFRNKLLKSPPQTPEQPIQASTSLAQDALLSPLRQLHLATTPSPSHSHHSDQDPLVQHDPSVNPDSPRQSPAQRASRKSQSPSTQTCFEATLAKASGQQVFGCGKFIVRLFKIITSKLIWAIQC
ncbi:uncharacterized protein MELLADRAFT_107057 [Melampsora larici-populina 98AG31]|uniref:Uncharacterized protein n=1 Tax=Melampsora larici-populina (strain 98AG31 / pathotype 3-4-7) TaxID=747676 RepID=F4RNI9_MELLP|nr:uncharacterized protein MELLADRAFT_107057 [Melampsora larici-populina 98AG31]EGG05995.1 hypothetical protein MELLADRAFT_107057 [Melampsora larici-populina 98AG31]